MAAKLSQSLATIQQDLLENGADYGFFQAFHLLNKVNDAHPVLPRRPRRRIDVRPELNLGFAESDVSEVIELDKGQGFEIISQLPGLYGVASPLPDYYTEELLDNEWDGLDAPREFLDLVHNQLLPKLYHAWKLYKLNINTVEENNSDYWTLLYSLLGDPNSQDSSEIQKLKLQFFSLFSTRERSLYGVKVIVETMLGLNNVEIEEFVTTQVSIPNELRCQLGSRNHQLGEAHLGCSIADRTNSIVVNTAELPNEKYSQLMDNQTLLDQTKQLISEYLNRPLNIKLCFKVNASNQPLTLGRDWNQLGITTRLPSKEVSVKEISIPLT